MKSSEKQLKIDIKYLKKVLDNNKDEINDHKNIPCSYEH